ncbi:MAG: hypothetical protein ACI9QC_000521 [Oceanicoccus sp.]|jgi:hypothetical protein
MGAENQESVGPNEELTGLAYAKELATQLNDVAATSEAITDDFLEDLDASNPILLENFTSINNSDGLNRMEEAILGEIDLLLTDYYNPALDVDTSVPRSTAGTNQIIIPEPLGSNHYWTAEVAVPYLVRNEKGALAPPEGYSWYDRNTANDNWKIIEDDSYVDNDNDGIVDEPLYGPPLPPRLDADGVPDSIQAPAETETPAPEAAAAAPDGGLDGFMARKDSLISGEAGSYTIDLVSPADVKWSKFADFNENFLEEGQNPEGMVVSSEGVDYEFKEGKWSNTDGSDYLKVLGTKLTFSVKAKVAEPVVAAPEVKPTEGTTDTVAPEPETVTNPYDGADLEGVRKIFGDDLEAHEAEVKEVNVLYNKVKNIDYRDRESGARYERLATEFGEKVSALYDSHMTLHDTYDQMVEFKVVEFAVKDDLNSRMLSANQSVHEMHSYFIGEKTEAVNPILDIDGTHEDDETRGNRREVRDAEGAEANEVIQAGSYREFIMHMGEFIHEGNELKESELALAAKLDSGDGNYNQLSRAHNRVLRQYVDLNDNYPDMANRLEAFKLNLEDDEYQRQAGHLGQVATRLRDTKKQLDTSKTQIEPMKTKDTTTEAPALNGAASTDSTVSRMEARDARLQGLWSEKMPELSNLAHSVNPDITLNDSDKSSRANGKNIELTAPGADGVTLEHRQPIKIRFMGVGPSDHYNEDSHISIKYDGDDYESIEAAVTAASKEFQQDRQEGKARPKKGPEATEAISEFASFDAESLALVEAEMAELNFDEADSFNGYSTIRLDSGNSYTKFLPDGPDSPVSILPKGADEHYSLDDLRSMVAAI